MSFNCSKELSIHVAPSGPVVTLRAYYKCEETTGTFAVDSHTNNLDLNCLDIFGATTVATGAGIIGNGFRCYTGGGNDKFFNSATPPTYSTNTDFDFSSTGFTIRLWHNPLSLTNDSLINCVPHPTHPWSLNLTGGKYVFNTHLTTGFIESDVTVTSTNSYGSGWHRIIIWWEPGVGCGMKIDNDASDTVANTTGVSLVPTLFYFAWAFGTLFSGKAQTNGDEFGLWEGKWSDAQMLYDWNSGAGRTYPDVPGI